MKQSRVNVSEAKAHLSRYAARVKNGERIILCERNVPFAEIRPLHPTPVGRRPFGLAEGEIELTDAFFDADNTLAGLFTSDDPLYTTDDNPKS
ncbi:MAG: hypothetical protein EA403_00005 [Spirochaetaceae bacterium]|nr:MAG: hypothetical protein EA403_00005 [Spirochaetaceae bacterium]